MFYLWNGLTYLFMLAFFGCLSLFIQGEQGIGSTLFAFFLMVVFFCLSVNRFSKPHHHFKAMRIVGYISIAFGLLCCFGLFSSTSLNDFITGIEIIFFFVSLGFIIYLYNRPVSNQESIEKPKEKEVIPQPKQSNMIETFYLSNKKAIQAAKLLKNQEIAKILKENEVLIKEIQANHYTIKDSLLKQIVTLLDSYVDLSDDVIKTDKKNQTIHDLEESFKTIHKALIKIYEDSCSNELLEIDSNVKTLEMQLKMNGLVDNDFDLEHD